MGEDDNSPEERHIRSYADLHMRSYADLHMRSYADSACVGQVPVVDLAVVRPQIWSGAPRLTVKGERPSRRTISRPPSPRARSVATRRRLKSEMNRLGPGWAGRRGGGRPAVPASPAVAGLAADVQQLARRHPADPGLQQLCSTRPPDP